MNCVWQLVGNHPNSGANGIRILFSQVCKYKKNKTIATSNLLVDDCGH